MHKTIRILTLVAAMIVTVGQTAWAEEITINLGEGRGTATFSESSLVFSKCEALEVGFSFDIPLEVMVQSKAYGGVVMQNYTATLDDGVTVDGTLTGEIVAAASQTYRYTVTKNEKKRQPVGVSTARTRTTDSGQPPYFVNPENINLSVPENTSKASAGQIKGKDDENDSFTFEITGGTAQDMFDIGLTTGNVSMKNGVEPFDYEAWKESDTKYTIKVDLCDTRTTSFNTDLCTQATFTVSVTDVNEKPYFTNKSDVINMAEGATISTDAITYGDPDKYTDEYLNNELVITGGASDLFELTSDGYVKPKDGAVIDKSEYEIVVRVRDANKDGENYIYPDLYNDKTFTIRYYATGVDYMDWDDTAKTLVSRNTATDDNAANDKVYILDGTENILGVVGKDIWYVAKGTLAYSQNLFLYGNVHLILANGAAMTVETTKTRAIDGEYKGNLAIYGQSIGDNMGSLTATASMYAINVDNVTISGGQVTAIAPRHGIYAGNITINDGTVTAEATTDDNSYVIKAQSGSNNSNGNLIIRGGTVTATCSTINNNNSYGIMANGGLTISGGQVTASASRYGIWLQCERDLTISGGQVTATGGTYGINNNGNIILGWTKADDYIYATSYKVKSTHTVSVDANGTQYMMAVADGATSGTAYTGTLSSDDLTAIAGKTLRRAQYKITAPNFLSVTVKDGTTTVEPVEVTEGSTTTPYYIYKEGLTVTATLKNTALVADYFTDTEVAFTDGEVTVGRPAVNAVEFDLPDADVTLSIDNLGAPTGGTMYLGIQDDKNNLTLVDDDVEILAYQGLEVVEGQGLCAVFQSVSEVPEGTTCILASATEGAALPATVGMSIDNTAAGNTAAESIRAAASPLLTTGRTGKTLGQVFTAAVTDEGGNPRTENGTAVSTTLADYLVTVLSGTSFRPVVADGDTPLTGSRCLLFVPKTDVLSYLNGTYGKPARTRSTDAGLRYIPIDLGDDATGIRSMDNGKWTMDNGEWYDLQGRRLNGAPTKKGVYVNSGKKVVVK